MISRTATREPRSSSDVGNRSRCSSGAQCLLPGGRGQLDRRAEGIPTAIRRHDTAMLFDWLISALSYQGISDQVATDYMERHGRLRWADIDAKVAACPTCPKLASYWHFHGAADTTRSAGLVQSRITSKDAPCPTSCAMGGSTRWPTHFSCSCVTLPTAT
jgi:hypothetical protein